MMNQMKKTMIKKYEASRVHIGRSWPFIVLALWTGLIGSSLWERYRPATDWLDVKVVLVQDTVAGVDPVIEFERIVKQRFRSDYVTEVQIQNDVGKWLSVCRSSGIVIFDVDKVPTNPLHLSRWTFPTDCTPQNPGTYRLSTIWDIDLPNSTADKQVSAISNPFKVLPKIKAGS